MNTSASPRSSLPTTASKPSPSGRGLGEGWPRIDWWALALLAPAFLILLWLFLVPAAWSVAGAFPLENFERAFTLYGRDIWFTTWIVTASVLIVAVLAVAMGGYLTLG